MHPHKLCPKASRRRAANLPGGEVLVGQESSLASLRDDVVKDARAMSSSTNRSPFFVKVAGRRAASLIVRLVRSGWCDTRCSSVVDVQV
jgi:hypothetical protein